MPQKKHLLTSKSTEELLEELEGSEEGPEIDIAYADNPVYLFLQRYKIKPGKMLVHKKHLFTLYMKTVMAPISKAKFITELGEFLDVEGNSVYINQNIAEVNRASRLDAKKKVNNQLILSSKIMKKFEEFLKAFNVEAGEDVYITAKSLYYFYQQWTYETKKRPSSYRTVINLIPIFLKQPINITEEQHYGINKSILEKVTQEQIEKAKAWSKKYKPPK
jgi:hypothetical protein